MDLAFEVLGDDFVGAHELQLLGQDYRVFTLTGKANHNYPFLLLDQYRLIFMVLFDELFEGPKAEIFKFLGFPYLNKRLSNLKSIVRLPVFQ